MGELGSLVWVAVVNGIIWGGLGWYAWRLTGELRRKERRPETRSSDRPGD